jgi:DsbC/DsbD-like thiol-disulfide interchange protein
MTRPSELTRPLAAPSALAPSALAPSALAPSALAPSALASSVLASSAFALCALALSVGAAAADDVSRWDGDARSAARLIAGSPPADSAAPLRAGIEIRLKPGWHTYWRYPGDAGVPPQFDFAGSQNVKDVKVLWPAPQRLDEDGATSIGYRHDVILPLQIVPQDAGKPVALKLKLDYAVCEKLCVPAQAAPALALGAGPATQDRALAAAEALVPRSRPLGDAPALAIRSVHRDAGTGKPRVIVDVAAPAGAAVDLFAEGPTPQWALPVPTRIDGAPAGLTRFSFELDGAPPGVKYDGAQLLLTAVSGKDAIEVSWRLD